ncbi:MAG TPA: amidase [Casimicrobiaceae bacterium]|jgi:aspartyl-tRNA(Asn)/glutamyl-tRNA(Gln) amidotransferase subunit A
MTAQDLGYLPLTELSRRLDAGETSSREIVSACLDRIAVLDGRLHAFIEVYREAALDGAKAADLERKAGMVRGPLHGLPIALKDLLHVSGRVTTAGSKTWHGRVAKETATAVERLLAAGMIPLGKTHMVEFAFGGWGRNEPMGAPWNPWDTRTHRVAGGSSSGSAVAVAAGLAPAAIGSDTGGSIRIPSALCGLTGLKPTYGTISLAGVVPLATTLDSLGPLARTVEDAALLTAAMAGPDTRDAATLGVPRLDFAAVLAGAPDVRRLRITALPAEQLPADTLPDVARALQQAIAVLREQGALVDEVRVPIDFEEVMVRNGRIIAAEAWALHREYIEDPKLPIDPWVRKRTIGGKATSAADYIDELSHRRRAAAAFADWMQGRDILLTPTLPITATPVDEVDEVATPLATFTRIANYLGICGVSLPAGMSADGLPVAVQLLGAPFAEAALVRAGRAFQQATEWHQMRPDLTAWEKVAREERV